jgi:hypothetical protein
VGGNLLEQFLVRRNTASVEIPRRPSTTGESPLYDLRFRWDASTPYRDPTMCRFIPALSVPKLLPLHQTGWGLPVVSITPMASPEYEHCFNPELRSKMFGQESGRSFWICERVLPRLKVSPSVRSHRRIKAACSVGQIDQ